MVVEEDLFQGCLGALLDFFSEFLPSRVALLFSELTGIAHLFPNRCKDLLADIGEFPFLLVGQIEFLLHLRISQQADHSAAHGATALESTATLARSALTTTLALSPLAATLPILPSLSPTGRLGVYGHS